MESLARQHRALATALVWWYVRRRVRNRAQAVAGLVSGEALHLRRSSKHGGAWWKWLLVLTVLGGVAWLAWSRLSGGGGDDWGTWEPAAPDPPATASSPLAGDLADAPDPVVAAGA